MITLERLKTIEHDVRVALNIRGFTNAEVEEYFQRRYVLEDT